MVAYVNHARIRSWNQPVLSNEGKVSCSRKQRGLELTTDRYPRTTSQTPLLMFSAKQGKCWYHFYNSRFVWRVM